MGKKPQDLPATSAQLGARLHILHNDIGRAGRTSHPIADTFLVPAKPAIFGSAIDGWNSTGNVEKRVGGVKKFDIGHVEELGDSQVVAGSGGFHEISLRFGSSKI